MKIKLWFTAFFLTLSGIAAAQSVSSNWQAELKNQLELYGHRNWILVVDKAYPLQSNPAIKTIVTGEEHLTVVMEVLNLIEKATHVDPLIYLDKEIDFVPEKEAEGIGEFKMKLAEILGNRNIKKELHEKLIAQIDEAAELFSILVLKTNLTIPYTSVFFLLECGYWENEQERKMRKLMN